MAQLTAGVTASWGGTQFGTVVEIKTTLGGSLPINRGATSSSLSVSVSSGTDGGTQSASCAQLNSPWGVDVGTIEILCLHTQHMTFSDWGQKRLIAIGGTTKVGTSGVTRSVYITSAAICQKIDIGAKVNDVWRFQGVFKLCKEYPNGANS